MLALKRSYTTLFNKIKAYVRVYVCNISRRIVKVYESNKLYAYVMG